MGNEIQQSGLTPGAFYYAVVRNGSGLYWNNTAGAFEAYNASHWTLYAVNQEAANTAGDWAGDFPVAITAAGTYAVQLRARATGTPLITDASAGQGEIRWSGTEEIDDVTDAPVSWAQAKVHLRLSSDDEQDYVEDLIDAATDHAEEAMACTLMARERSVTFYRGGPMYLPKGPLISVTSIIDADAKTITDYDLEKVGNADLLTINEGFTYPLEVVYQAGYASASDIPAAIRQAILCHVGTLYENRESVSDKSKTPVPHSLEAFYRLKRRSAGVA